MKEVEEAFRGHQTTYVTYESPRTRELPGALLIPSMVEKPWTIPQSILRILVLYMNTRPSVVISTGAEIAFPLFIIAKIFRAKTIYLETCARISTPSFTGRAVYPFSDHFLVQWEELTKKFGNKAVYEGGLI